MPAWAQTPTVALLTFTLGPSAPFSPQHGSLRPLDEVPALTGILKGPTDPAHWPSSSAVFIVSLSGPWSAHLRAFAAAPLCAWKSLPRALFCSASWWDLSSAINQTGFLASSLCMDPPPSPSVLLRPQHTDPPPLSANHPPASCTQTTPTVCQSSSCFLHTDPPPLSVNHPWASCMLLFATHFL